MHSLSNYLLFHNKHNAIEYTMTYETQECGMRMENGTMTTGDFRGKHPIHPRCEMQQMKRTSFSTNFTFKEQLGHVATSSPCFSSSYKVQTDENAYHEERKLVSARARIRKALLFGNESQLAQKQLFVDYEDRHDADTMMAAKEARTKKRNPS